MTDIAPPKHTPGRWPLWFGLFGGLTAWMLHLAIGFVIVHDGCAVGLGNIRLLVGAATLVFALVAAAATWVAYHSWRETDPGDEAAQLSIRNGRARFMSLLGIGMSGLALLIIVLLTIPTIWLNPCA